MPPEPGAAPSHSLVCVFHWIFKVAGWIWFVIGNFLLKDFTIDFVVLLVLIAADFWVVKNVTGRLLVGLRWWNDASENGKDDGWRFESLQEGQRQINSGDKMAFWVGLVANVLVWLVFGVYTAITFNFQWLLSVILALILGIANLWGYFRCSREAKKAVSDLAQSAVSSTLQAALNKV